MADKIIVNMYSHDQDQEFRKSQQEYDIQCFTFVTDFHKQGILTQELLLLVDSIVKMAAILNCNLGKMKILKLTYFQNH